MKAHYKGLGHIAVYTEDMEKSIAFYEKIGGEVVNRFTAMPPEGPKPLALVNLGGVVLELIQSPTPMPMTEGNIPHIAIYVDDVDAAAADLKALGVDTFLTPAKRVVPAFGGLENWFFTGPSGEQIELLKML